MTDTTRLHRVVYCSRNVIADVAGEVKLILAASRRNNPQDGITGALLYSEGCFAQVLEGLPAALERCFERIQRDLRHADVVVLDSKPADERMFGDWSMAYADALGPQATRRLGLKRASSEPHSCAAEKVVRQLYEIVRIHADGIPA